MKVFQLKGSRYLTRARMRGWTASDLRTAPRLRDRSWPMVSVVEFVLQESFLGESVEQALGT